MIEKRNRTAEDQVRKIAFRKYDRQIFEEKTKELYNFFPTQLRMEKLSHRIHNLRDRKFRGEPRLLVPKVSSSDQQQFIKFWNGKNQCTMFFPMEIDMFEILNYYFSSRWCKVVQILE